MNFSIAENRFGRFLSSSKHDVTDASTLGEMWESDLVPLITAAASPHRVAIDAGSNVGFLSVQMSKHFQKVFSFEPRKNVFYNLCANILLNDCFNISALCLAVYKETTRLSFEPTQYSNFSFPTNDEADCFPSRDTEQMLDLRTAEGAEGVDAVTIDNLHSLDVGLIRSDFYGLNLWCSLVPLKRYCDAAPLSFFARI